MFLEYMFMPPDVIHNMEPKYILDVLAFKILEAPWSSRSKYQVIYSAFFESIQYVQQKVAREPEPTECLYQGG